MKTKIKVNSNDQHGDFKAGETGFIDGYLTVDERPYAVVCFESGKFALVQIFYLERLTPLT